MRFLPDCDLIMKNCFQITQQVSNSMIKGEYDQLLFYLLLKTSQIIIITSMKIYEVEVIITKYTANLLKH